MAGKKGVVCLAGFAAVGKSTVGKLVAKKLGFKYVSGGDALQEVAREMGYRPTGPGWWETAKGLEFLRLRKKDPSIDRKVDEKLLEICRRGGVVVDSWVMPWLYSGRALKVWMKADKRVRAERMAGRSGIKVSQALRLLTYRDRESARIYSKLYRIKIGEDLSPFHLIIDTSNLTPEQAADAIAGVAKLFFRISPKHSRRRR